jgi:deoxyribonuclease-4
MDRLLFGTGGSPHSSRGPSTVDGIERIAELGLGCMEMEFVRGVHMGKDTALEVAETARRLSIRLTAHAPYFINLYSAEPEKIKRSKDRIIQTARVASLCGADSIAFHPAFYGGDKPEEVYPVVKSNLEEVIDRLKQEDNKVWIRPEVMGKVSQFGTITELLNLSRELEHVMPVIDFAHWHARTGKSNTYTEFAAILEQIEKALGRSALDNMHMHISGIMYGAKGERKHLDLAESDFNYKELVKAFRDYDVKGYAVCESPNLEEDARLLQDEYDNLS